MDEDLQKELDDMDDNFLSEDPEESEESEESVDEEETGEETEEESEEGKGSEESEAAETEEESEETEETEEETSTPDKTNDELRAEIERLNGLILNQHQPVMAPVEKKVEPKVESVVPAAPEPIDFVKDLDMDDISAKPEVFNQILNAVVQQVASQNIAPSPQLISDQVKQQLFLNNTVERFYAENKDLESVKQTVGAVATNLSNENPTWAMDKILTEAAKNTRKILKLPEYTPAVDGNVKSVESDPKKAGAKTPKTNAKKKGKTKRSKLQMEIDEL